MKPFDFEKAKAGAPVCTRDGKKARIICFDLKNKDYPIVAVFSRDHDVTEFVDIFTKEGRCSLHAVNSNDLVMAPEKKKVWVNIFKEQEKKTYLTAYKTKELAEEIGECFDDYIKTVELEWEE